MTCESCLLVRSWGDTTQNLVIPELTLLSEFTMWGYCLNFPWLEELHKDRPPYMRSELFVSPFVSRIYSHCNFSNINSRLQSFYIPTYCRSSTHYLFVFEYNCLWPRICFNDLNLQAITRVGNLHLTSSCLNLNPCGVVDTYHLKGVYTVNLWAVALQKNIWHHLSLSLCSVSWPVFK